MAIDKISGSGGFGRPEKLNEPGQSAGRTGTSKRAPGDRLELSSEARQAAALADRVRSLPDVRRELVDAVRRDVDAGTYRFDPQSVARAFVEFEDELAS